MEMQPKGHQRIANALGFDLSVDCCILRSIISKIILQIVHDIMYVHKVHKLAIVGFPIFHNRN
jgi:hypothetical protein